MSIFGGVLLGGILLWAWIHHSSKHYKKQLEKHQAINAGAVHQRGAAIEDLTGE